jgi:hypothetical protein
MRPECLRQCNFQETLEMEQTFGMGSKPCHAVTGGKMFLEAARCHRKLKLSEGHRRHYRRHTS